jgi:hypothetical protein
MKLSAGQQTKEGKSHLVSLRLAGQFSKEACKQTLICNMARLLNRLQDEMRSLRKFVALCFARIGLDTGQTRAIATNILGRQPGMTPKICDTILDKSAETAKKNLTRQTPQIAQILDVYDQFLTKTDREPDPGK